MPNGIKLLLMIVHGLLAATYFEDWLGHSPLLDRILDVVFVIGSIVFGLTALAIYQVMVLFFVLAWGLAEIVQHIAMPHLAGDWTVTVGVLGALFIYITSYLFWLPQRPSIS